MRRDRRDERRGRIEEERKGREPWINVFALKCPSTGGDRGTANSVGSCSRQAAGLSSAQRSASFASEREPSAKIGARNKTTWVRAGCFAPYPHRVCTPSHPLLAIALVGLK